MARDLMDSIQPEVRSYSRNGRNTPDHSAIEMDRMGRNTHSRNGGPRNGPPRNPRAPPSAYVGGHQSGHRPGQRPVRANSSANFTDFNQKIERIQQSISKAYAQIDQVKQAHEETLNTTGDFRLSQSTARRDDQISHTQSMMSQVNSEMRALRELKNQYMSSHSVANSQKALLQSRYQKVGRDVKALLTAYSKVSKDYSTQYREKLKKQYRIANPSATEEEVDEAVYNDDAHQAFAQAVSNSSRVQNATRVLSSVKQRHDDVKKIAKTIEELAALIQELSELVDEQQVQLDSIEDAVEASNTHVQSAQVAIGEGIVLAKKTRKCKWWFILAALILAIVIGVVLYLKLRPN